MEKSSLDIQTRIVDQMWSALKATWNDPVIFWLAMAILTMFVVFITFNLVSLYREKMAEHLAAEDRLRRQQRYEWEFRHLPETERRIQVYLALQADLYLPRIERLPAEGGQRLEPRLKG